ncbi:MAG TPA: hypothetical protein VFU54_02520 [Actinomycetota bacterium]|nr:hypothetical protein [Actinomycetota bacterium]
MTLLYDSVNTRDRTPRRGCRLTLFTDDELLAGLEAWPFVPDGLEAYRRYLAERR